MSASLEMAFAAAVRAERARRNWTQVELAARANVSEPYIVRIEKARAPHMSLDKAALVAYTLGISLDAIIAETHTRYDDVAEAAGRGD